MTLWALAAQRFRRDRVGVASAAIVLAFILVAIASGVGLIARDWGQEVGVSYAPPGFVEGRTEQKSEAKVPQEDYGIADPLAAELAEIHAGLTGATGVEAKARALAFGADKWGRDVLKKVIKGTETSLLVGLAAAALATFLGTLFGALAGYYGRWIDDFFNWLYSVFTSIPYLLLVLAVAAVLGQKGTLAVILILGLTGWTGIFRLIRAEYLRHRVREYVLAADAVGASNARRMFAHILPNASHVVLVQLSLHVVLFIKSEVILSFLGFGVGVDTVSWGSMLAEAPSELILGMWWQIAVATAAMALAVTAFSLFTDSVRDALESEAAMSLLSVRDLRVSFGAVAAVKGISFEVPENTTVALVGESGSGKSVTALSILGLLPTNARTRGEILFEGRNVPGKDLRGAQVSMIFQEPMSSLNPVFTVGFQVGEALKASRRAARKRSIELLDEVGLSNPEAKLDRYPFQLSGGEQQRVMIAMAIACEPKLLIADEPTSALDVTVQKQILELIAALRRRRRMSMLFITHDLALVKQVAEHVVVMRAGEIREQGSVAEVYGSPRDDYTRMLLDARPRMDQPARTRLSTETILEARGLAKSFDGHQAVKGASFKLSRGRTLGLVGESGSGKTTLGLLVTRLHQASGGELRFHGEDVRAVPPLAFKRRVQIVFQNPYASLNPRFSIGQTLTEPMRIHDIGADAGERRSLAAGLLAKVGLPESALFKYPHEFSGGQRQRIAIARALVLQPELVICDEAVSALDVSIQAQLLNLLRDLQDEYAMSYLFISHDLAVVKSMADEVMVMKDGEIVEHAGVEEIYGAPRHPYTQALLAAVPQ